MAQWFRLCASNAGDAGLIPGWETKIPHVAWCSQNIKKSCLQKSEINQAIKKTYLQFS